MTGSRAPETAHRLGSTEDGGKGPLIRMRWKSMRLRVGTHMPATVQNYLGLTLLPHSGVSLVFTGIICATLSASRPDLVQIVQSFSAQRPAGAEPQGD